MKMRRLPEIDLARIAPLPREEKFIYLRRQKAAAPPYAYDPLRSTLSDILNASYPLFKERKPTSWEKIERKIRSRARSSEEYAANVKLAELLFQHAVTSKLAGRSEDFFPFPIGLDEKVSYWFRLSYLRDGHLVVPFIDPRKHNSLGPKGRRFAFSMMKEAIREPNPDFDGARFEILHFGKAKTGERTLNIHLDAGVELYSFEELDFMVRETYEVWFQVLREREEEDRKKAAGERGPLI